MSNILELELSINNINYEILEIVNSDNNYYYLRLSPEFQVTPGNNYYIVNISNVNSFELNSFSIPDNQSLVDKYIQSEIIVAQDNNVYLSNIEIIENVDDQTEGLLAFIGNLDLYSDIHVLYPIGK